MLFRSMLGIDNSDAGGRIEILQKIVMGIAQRTYEDKLVRGAVFVEVAHKDAEGFAIIPFSLKENASTQGAFEELRGILGDTEIETLVIAEKNAAGDEVIVSIQSYSFGLRENFKGAGTLNEFCILVTKTNGKWRAEREPCVLPVNMGHDLLKDKSNSAVDEIKAAVKGVWLN